MVDQTEKNKMVRDGSLDTQMVAIGAEIPKLMQLKLQQVKLDRAKTGKDVTQAELILEAIHDFTKAKGL